MLVNAQRNEITEHYVYELLRRKSKMEENSEILQRLSRDEKQHYGILRSLTRKDVPPRRLIIFGYLILANFLGLTFTLKLMEKNETKAEEMYNKLSVSIEEIKKMVDDEDRHENLLLSLINEERLKYTGSIILGLNDALVELTGSLAGFTFAFQSANLIAMAGLITGISAALSMGVSEYLSTRAETGNKNPKKASGYTTAAYIFTVIALIIPFFMIDNVFWALLLTIAVSILVIVAFTYYISIAKDLPFKSRFLEMAGLSLGVALFSFLVGYFVRIAFNIDI
ncbi:MAG: VIT1/CCC1 transporter family protein [Methanomassiliicoccales archaeon]